MKSPLRIVHLEDNPNDAELIRAALEGDAIACSVRLMHKEADFTQAIEGDEVDLAIADFSLPNFNGFAALELVRKRRPGLPFILVSGTLGEELAIDAIKQGATDYVLKERLYRLGPAVRRAMREVEERRERDRLQAGLVEAQKMEVVGQLAGGVAHDFNNILAVIMGYSDLALSELAPGERARDYTEEVRHAAERAAGLTQQLLVFCRKQAVQTEVLDLNEVVQGMEKMLRRLIGENIELGFFYEKSLGRIRADSGQVGQVLMNLVVNARDAMPNGGKLTVATAGQTVGAEQISAGSGAAPGDYVVLSVSDTGLGMSDEVKAHIFEAFFTTKPKGKGTGLGLATCQTVAKQGGGFIGVQSALGRGTTFKVYLPRVDQATAAAAHPAAPEAMPRGTERILLVEDEPSVRQLARSVLQALGYKVLSASNGEDGLRVARECKEPIQLVITDVVMPQMDGKAMVEGLKGAYPNLNVLFTSGYLDDTIAPYGAMEHHVAFLAKPYTLSELAQKVREVLNGAQAGST